MRIILISLILFCSCDSGPTQLEPRVVISSYFEGTQYVYKVVPADGGVVTTYLSKNDLGYKVNDTINFKKCTDGN